MKNIYLIVIVFVAISGTGFLTNNVFSIDLQPFKVFTTIPDFDQPACECAGSDGTFSMTNCNAFDGNPYTDPNMLCQWEVGIESYGEPSSSDESCEAVFWSKSATESNSIVTIEPSIHTDVWPPGYNPDYFYEDMFHITLVNIPENIPEEKDDKDHKSKDDKISKSDVIGDGEVEIEIEVEIEDGTAKIEVEIGDEELEFELEETDRELIIQYIADNSDLTIEEIETYIEFEEDEKEKNSKDDRSENDVFQNDIHVDDKKKILICHIPYDNPDNPITISIYSKAKETHLKHGDYLGECVEPDLGLTLLEALNLQGDGLNKLIRESVAAMLNAAHSDVDYPHTVVQVISMTQVSLASSDYDETGILFEELNNDLQKPLLCLE